MPAELDAVYLLGGSDRPKIQRALQRLRARVGADAVELLSAGETSGAETVASCNALGLFTATAKLVVVDGVDVWKAADVKAIAEYLADPAPTTVLALVAAEAKKDSPLAKACAAAGTILLYDVAKRDLPRWVAAQFERLGASAEQSACRLLVALVGDDLVALAGEVEKVAAWAGGEPIRDSDVERLVPPLAETPGFALTDAWARRDVAAVLTASEAIFERGGRRDEASRLAGMLNAHVARLRECQLLAEQGVRPKEAAGRLRRSPYYVQKLFAQAEAFSAAELQQVSTRLAALDFALKGGSRLPGDLELDRALVDITAAPGPKAGG